MSNSMKQLCNAPNGQTEVLQGDIAFAVGCVRGGVHAAGREYLQTTEADHVAIPAFAE